MKKYDPINGTTGWTPDPTPVERAKFAIRCAVKTLTRPDIADDCRRLARGEIRRWRKILMTAK